MRTRLKSQWLHLRDRKPITARFAYGSYHLECGHYCATPEVLAERDSQSSTPQAPAT